MLASSSGGELFNAKRSPAIANSGVSLDQGEGTLAVMPVASIRALRQVWAAGQPCEAAELDHATIRFYAFAGIIHGAIVATWWIISLSDHALLLLIARTLIGSIFSRPVPFYGGKPITIRLLHWGAR